MSSPPVLPNIDPLPCPKGASRFDDGDGDGGLGEARLDVRGHIVWTLRGMAVEPISIGYQPIEESIEITSYVGIGVLGDD